MINYVKQLIKLSKGINLKPEGANGLKRHGKINLKIYMNLRSNFRIYSRSSRRVWSNLGSRPGRCWPKSKLGMWRSHKTGMLRNHCDGNRMLHPRIDKLPGHYRDMLPRGEPSNFRKRRVRGERRVCTAKYILRQQF